MSSPLHLCETLPDVWFLLVILLLLRRRDKLITWSNWLITFFVRLHYKSLINQSNYSWCSWRWRGDDYITSSGGEGVGGVNDVAVVLAVDAPQHTRACSPGAVVTFFTRVLLFLVSSIHNKQPRARVHVRTMFISKVAAHTFAAVCGCIAWCFLVQRQHGR